MLFRSPPETAKGERGEVRTDGEGVPAEVDVGEGTGNVCGVEGTRSDDPDEDGEASEEADAGPPREETTTDELRRGIGCFRGKGLRFGGAPLAGRGGIGEGNGGIAPAP